VIRYRPFLNCDPPELVRVWREQPAERGLMQPVSNLLLEMFVLSKPYFDREGLIVAVDDNRVLGFVHGGFGPNADRSDLATEIGLVCMLVVQQHAERTTIMRELLSQCEAYLRGRGALEFRVGATFPLSPFYMGLHGGSDLPGIGKSDEEMKQFYTEQGYEPSGGTIAFVRALDRFRPPVDRQVLQHRRQYQLVPQVNPSQTNWWESCVFGPTDRIRFLLTTKQRAEPCGEITYWDMGPLSTRAGSGGMGLINLQIAEPLRGQGLGLFLAAESLKQLENSGVHRIETQTHRNNQIGQRMLKKLEFFPLREGIALRKTA
jgi:GNAT superfamily N-acetyltransferase